MELTVRLVIEPSLSLLAMFQSIAVVVDPPAQPGDEPELVEGVVPAVAKRGRGRPRKEAAPAPAAEAPQEPVLAPAPTAPAPAAPTGALPPHLTVVKAALQELIDAQGGLTADAAAILGKFGAKRLSQLPADKAEEALKLAAAATAVARKAS